MSGNYQCPRATDRGDGRCDHCGRACRFEEQFGKVVHVRGRIAGVSPWKKSPPVDAPDGSAGFIPRAVVKDLCPDCDGQLQEITRGVLRCPWSATDKQHAVEGVVACGWPRGTKRPAVEDVA